MEATVTQKEFLYVPLTGKKRAYTISWILKSVHIFFICYFGIREIEKNGTECW